MILPVGEQRETGRVPYGTITLIVLNVLVFLGEQTLSDAEVLRYCFDPAHPDLMHMVCAMFLHGGWGHLLGNMWFLWLVGPNVEDALTSLGMLALYLFTGCVACLAYAAMLHATGAPMMPMLGASGAIAGLMGASLVIFPRKKITFFYWVFWFWSGTFEIDAFWAIGAWFLEQLLLNWLDQGGGIAYGAHIGGFVVSAIIALFLLWCRLVEPHWKLQSTWRERQLEMDMYRRTHPRPNLYDREHFEQRHYR